MTTANPNFTCPICRSIACMVTKTLTTYSAGDPINLQCEDCMTKFTLTIHSAHSTPIIRQFMGIDTVN